MMEIKWEPAKSAPFAERVLVACARGDVLIAVRAEYMGWMRDGDGSSIFDLVTHWAPIPPAPERARKARLVPLTPEQYEENLMQHGVVR